MKVEELIKLLEKVPEGTVVLARGAGEVVALSHLYTHKGVNRINILTEFTPWD